jgi:hypothetical protein
VWERRKKRERERERERERKRRKEEEKKGKEIVANMIDVNPTISVFTLNIKWKINFGIYIRKEQRSKTNPPCSYLGKRRAN